MSYNKSYENIIENLKQLLRIPSVMGIPEQGMPFGRETYLALEYMLNLGKNFGFTVKNVDGYAGHIEWGEGNDLFGVLCHLDVVPAGEDWLHPPFGAVCENNKIYARGALDDKSPAIAVLYAVKRLKDEGFVPNKKFRLIMGLNEESGWKCMDYYLTKEKMPDSGFAPDADFPIINCEKGVLFLKLTFASDEPKLKVVGGGTRVNMVPDKAFFEYEEKKQVFSGISAHGSSPHKGKNAIVKMLTKLKELTCDSAVNNIYKFFCAEDFLKTLNLDIEDEKSGKLTLNPGLIETNGGEITLSVDIRFPVSYTKDDILERLSKSLNGICKIEVENYHRPLYIAPEDELIVKLSEAYEKVTGTKGDCISIGGATYARVLERGVAFGPVFPHEESKIHTADESIDTERLYIMTDIYYEALKSLLA